MADAVLSVEVRAKLEALSKGLSDGQKSIGDFVAAGDRNLSKIEARFQSLGKTTKEIADNIKSSLGGMTLDKYFATFGNSQEVIAQAKAEVAKYRAEIAALKKEAQALTTSIKEKAKALGDARVATEQARAATQNQRTATEAERTENVRLRNELQALRIARAANAQQQTAANGSYREAQQRLTALGNAIRNAEGGFARNGRAVRDQVKEYNKLNAKLKEFDRAMGNHQRNVGNYRSGFLQSIPIIGQYASAIGLAMAAQQAFNKSFQTNLKLDALEYAIQRISGTSKDFADNMAFLRISADRLGLDFVSTAEAFKMWQGAVQYSNLTAEQSRSIFESVANAGAQMKLSTDEVRGTFLALSQMLSKGTVSMEELRRQLGDRLPGAFSLAAKAMNMSESQLNKLVASGQLMSEEFLPKFAQQLDIAFGNDKTEKIESLQASTARLKSEWDLLWRSDSATGFFKDVTGGLANLLQRINGTETATYNLRGEYERTENQFHDTYRNAVLLAQEYDNLKGKTNLTKEEQEELNNKIKEIGEIMPMSVTKWNEYGDAIEINRGKLQGMTNDLLEWRRIQNEDTLNGLQSEFNKYYNQAKAYQSILDKYSNFSTDDPKQAKYIEDQIKFYKRLATEASGTAYEQVVEIRGTGLVNLTKDQKDIIKHFEGTKDAVEDVNKELVKNKGYWEDTVKALKKQRDDMTSDQIGGEAWNKLSESIKEAKKNLDKYSVSNKSLNGGGGSSVANKLEAYAKGQKKLNEILSESYASVNKKELTGIAKAVKAIDDKYDNWVKKAKESGAEVSAISEFVAKLEENREAEKQKTITKMMDDSLKERKEKQLQAARDLADAEKKEQEKAIDGMSLSYSRRNETGLQRRIRDLQKQFKTLEDNLKDNLKSQVAIGAEITPEISENRLEQLQKELDAAIETEHTKNIEIELAMTDGRNMFNKPLKELELQIQEIQRKMQNIDLDTEGGREMLENLKAQNEELLYQQDILNTTKGFFDSIGQSLYSSLSTAITEGESFIEVFGNGIQDVFKTLLQNLIQMGVQLLINKALAATFGADQSKDVKKNAAESVASMGVVTAAGVAAAKITGAAWATPAALVAAASFGGSAVAGTAALAASVAASKGLLGFKTGGYTGNGGVNEVAGVVHGKEFVFDAQSTKRIGVNNLKALQMGQIPDLSTNVKASTLTVPKSVYSTPKRERMDVNVNVSGRLQNNDIRLSGDRADKFNRKFGRG